jgi:3-deoxy-7-phosphoheptulonate synthase
MYNARLIYRAARDGGGTPILLKRGFGATIEEWLWAAEYALLGRVAAGRALGGLYLCERGIRTFEPTTRFTLDVSSIPTVQERTRIPVLADPSHPAGKRSLVPALARASLAAGASGLLIEVHNSPEEAWSDGGQALHLRDFQALASDIRRISTVKESTLAS